MRLRLLIDVDADERDVAEAVERCDRVWIEPKAFGGLHVQGSIVGAVPVEGESVAAAAAELARHEAGLGGLEDE